jgi:hypothetical protein
MLLALPVAAAAAPKLSDAELQRFVYQSGFPPTCGSAKLAVNDMRVKPTTDPASLHAKIAAFIACAKSPYAANDGPLFNRSIFAAGAASLLAARHGAGAVALGDARNAQHAADLITGYTRGLTPAQRSVGVNKFEPSPLITDANRIGADATALIATLAGGGMPATTAVPGVPAFPATPVPGHGPG